MPSSLNNVVLGVFVCMCDFAFGLTRDRVDCVWCNKGSGSKDRWIHSGIFIVPPSRSAMITSN